MSKLIGRTADRKLDDMTRLDLTPHQGGLLLWALGAATSAAWFGGPRFGGPGLKNEPPADVATLLKTAQILAGAHEQAIVAEREYQTLVLVLEQCAGQFADQMPPGFCLDLKALAATLRDTAALAGQPSLGKPNASESQAMHPRAAAS